MHFAIRVAFVSVIQIAATYLKSKVYFRFDDAYVFPK